MAVVTVGVVGGFDIDEVDIGGTGEDGTLNLVDSTKLEISYPDGDLDTFTGTGFVLTDGELTAGTITGFTQTHGPDLVLSYTGVSFDVPTFVTWIDNNDNAAFLSALLGGQDTFNGSDFDDVFNAGAGADSVIGGDGDDILRGESGDDTLMGGEGEDLLTGGSAADLIDGEGGHNRASYFDASGGVSVDLTRQGEAQDTGWGVDTLNNIANVTGTVQADTLTGDDEANWLWGVSGNDVIDAGGGDDVVTVGGGTSTLIGGSGHDVLEFSVENTAPAVNVSLAQSSAQNTGLGSKTISGFEGLAGTDNGDTLTGDGLANTLAGGLGGDVLNGGGGADTLLGDGVIATGNGLSSWIADYGANGADTLDGGDGDDSLVGGGGADLLIGGLGNDTIDAGAGNDHVVLGPYLPTFVPGDDNEVVGQHPVAHVTLGGGADILEISQDFGQDGQVVVSDFQPGVDKVVLGFFLKDEAENYEGGDDPFASHHLHLVQDGADTVLQLDLDGGGDGYVEFIRFQNATVTAADIDYSDPTDQGDEEGETFPGTTGADSHTGSDLDDVLTGLAGNDTLAGAGGDDLIDGGDDRDLLRGDAGADTLLGGNGDDVLKGGDGDDSMDGGAGRDRVDFEAPHVNLTIDLTKDGVAQNTGAGVDTIRNVEDVIAGWGNDTITGTDQGNWLDGYDGADSISAGDGDDTVTLGYGNATVDGGSGVDTLEIDLPEAAPGANISLALQNSAQTTGVGSLTLSGIENLVGTYFHGDTLTGNGVANVLAGSGGGDVLSGGGGNDTLLGDGVVITGSGAPYFVDSYGVGDDTIYAGDGDDLVRGGSGADLLYGEVGNDTVEGGAGDDIVWAGQGADVLDGGAGVDRLTFSGGPAVNVDLAVTTAQNTGAGLKTITGFEDVYGTTGNDTLSGDNQDNYIWGNNGGADVMNGRGGDDLLIGANGNHTIDGGAGLDTFAASYSATGAVNISLALQNQAQDTGQGVLLLSNLERLAGTVYGDTLTGDTAANVLAGMKGADSLVGGGGNDLLLGDGEITAINGHITVLNAPSDAAPAGAAGDDILNGGAGNDTIVGGDGADTAVFSGARSDYSFQVQGNGDLLVTDLRSGGPDGADTLKEVEFLRFSDGVISASAATSGSGQSSSGTTGADSLAGGSFADTLSGLAGDDTLSGGGGNDSIDGAAGYDFLRGEAGNDTLLGGDDDDFLNGGAGDDQIDGGAGIDRVSYGDAGVAVTVDLTKQGQAQITGYGTDTLNNVEQVSGTAFNDVLTGDNNANWLWGLGGGDTISAGGGNDLVQVGRGAASVNGGSGTDVLGFYSETLTGPVNVSLLLQGAAQNTSQGSMTIVGFEGLSGTITGGDTLTGDNTANTLAGWGGNDRLVGNDGDDLLLGDGVVFPDGGPLGLAGAGPITTYETTEYGGADLLNGGAGNDTLIGGGGDDQLTGLSGNDRLDGGDGEDYANFYEATGSVTIDLAAGTASSASTGSDTLISIERVVASAFADTVTGSSGANVIQAFEGNDQVFAGGGNDQVLGGSGSDQLFGEAGNDTVSGEAGDDYVSGGVGDDVLDGGAGVDRAAFSAGATAGVTVDLNIQGVAQNTGQGMDTLIGIENLSGTRYGDQLTGDNNANWLWGGSDGSGVTGNDTISAGGGNDLVQVGAGDHSLDGGAGTDVLSFQGNNTDINAGVSVTLGAGGPQTTNQGSMTLTGFEGLSGSTYGDTLTGDNAANVLAGYGGSDSLVGGGGNDTLLGDGLIHVSNANSSAITTLLDQGSGADTLDGGGGSDSIVGGAGNDRIISGTGNDTIDAGDGVDTIIAQAGSGETTRIALGAGADTLRLDTGFNGAIVTTDFEAGTGGDVLDWTDYLASHLTGWNGTDNPFQAGFLQLVQDGNATLVQMDVNGGGDSFATFMTLQNTSSARLNASNLGFQPLPLVKGGSSGDSFEWKEDSPVKTVDGGLGSDIVEIHAPAATSTTSVQQSANGLALEFDFNGDHIADLTVTGVEDIVLNGERVVISGDLSRTGLAPNTITYMGTAGDNLLDASGLTSVESIHAEGNGGNDTLIGAGDDDYLSGGAGADSLVGNDGPDLFDGGAGADTIDGGLGTDTASFSGDSSAYTVTASSGGVLDIVGPDGSDHLVGVEYLQFDNGTFGENHAPSGSDGSVSVTNGGTKVLTATVFGIVDPDHDDVGAVRIVTLPGSGTLTNNGVAVTSGQWISAADLAAGHLVFTPAGTGSTTFTFQVQDDGLATWGANTDLTPNTLTLNTSNPSSGGGGGGGGVISTGTQGTAGADLVILTGTANHSFFAGDGADTVTTGSGADVVQGNAGADVVNAGGGADTVYGGRDNDQLNGEDGDDWLSGDLGNDTLTGGAGFDIAFGGDGNDSINGGEGESYLRGGEGSDVITGGGAFDNMQGNAGSDTLRGGGGGDWVVGGKDQDSLFGDDGDDIVLGNMGEDSCVGGAGADTVRGGQGSDVIDGGTGNDWLSGDLGDDTLTGGAGADVFHSFNGAGIDRVLDFHLAEGDRIQLDAGTTYTTAQVGADTVISLGGGGQVVLVGVQMTSLTGGWIFEL